MVPFKNQANRPINNKDEVVTVSYMTDPDHPQGRGALSISVIVVGYLEVQNLLININIAVLL